MLRLILKGEQGGGPGKRVRLRETSSETTAVIWHETIVLLQKAVRRVMSRQQTNFSAYPGILVSTFTYKEGSQLGLVEGEE